MSNTRCIATATTAVRGFQQTAYDEPAQGPALSRVRLEEAFNGDIEGSGVTEFLYASHADGSASFTGLERVEGTVDGRRGTFVLQQSGTVAANVVSAEWAVVPGSGTGDLAGLRGSGGVRADLGQGGTAHLDYWFE